MINVVNVFSDISALQDVLIRGLDTIIRTTRFLGARERS